MNKKMRLGFLVCAVIACTQSFGQGRPSLSIGLEVGVPTGDLNATQKIGIGGSAKAAFPVAEDLDLTVSAGYINFSGDEVPIGTSTFKAPSINLIPIKAGVRYRFAPSGFYVEPQLGYTSINTPNSSTSGTGGFTYAAGAGYMINNQWDISARYEGISKKTSGNPPTGGNLPYIGARLAYSFKL